MSKISRGIIVGCAVFVLVAGVIIYSVLKSRAIAVPDGVIGNTAGNLNNKGLFCESEGVVYFANPYDNGSLYSMTPDMKDLKKICDLSVEYINVGGDYVFFYGEPSGSTTGIGSVVSKPGMYMVHKNGDVLKALTKDISQSMVLYGGKIYYQHYTKAAGSTFAVIDIKKHESTELLDYMINPASLYGSRIYYNGMYQDHFLYAYDVASDTNELIWEGNT